MQDLTATHTADIAPLRIDELLRSDAFSHPVEHLELRETSRSWVILTGPFAYKIKKPMKEPMDPSTLEARRRLCEAELQLSRRYAAEIYLDVVPISRSQGRAAVGAVGSAIDYAVRMKQFEACDALEELLERNDVALQEVVSLAERIADSHMLAPIVRSSGGHSRTAQIHRAVLGNLAELIAHLPPTEPPGALGRVIDWTHDHIRSLDKVLEQREDSGCIRDCHGDLRTANIVRWQGCLIPIDGIDSDPQLRRIDVMADLASLIRDLASHKRSDLALALLSRYLEITGDYDGVLLLRFYVVHSALVRAKADVLAAERLPDRANECRARARLHLRAAVAWSAPRRPALILMHGTSSSGRSRLSEHLIVPLSAIRVRAELERKRLAGIKPQLCASAGLWPGVQSKEFTCTTYERLAECAEKCLQAGFNTIVDASFLDPADRDKFRRLAERLGAAWTIISCRSDSATTFDPCVSLPFSADEQRHVVTIDSSDTGEAHRVVTSVGGCAGTPLDLADERCSA